MPDFVMSHLSRLSLTYVVCCHHVISGSIATSFHAASSTNTALDGMLDAIANDVNDQKTISFYGNNYQFEKSMLVDNKPHNNVEEAVSYIDVDTSALSKTVEIIASHSTVFGEDNWVCFCSIVTYYNCPVMS